MLARSLRHRAPVLWLLLPFMAGLVAARAWPQPVSILPVGTVAVACLVLASLARHTVGLWAGAVCASLFCAGLCHYAFHAARLLAWEELPARQARLTLRVERRYASPSGARNVSGVGRITGAGALINDLIGQRVAFSARASADLPTVVRSAEIEVVGVIEPLPFNAPATTFTGHLVNSGVHFRLGRARVVSQVKPPTAYRRFCDAALARFSAILGRGLGSQPRLTAVLRGILLGEAGELSSEQKDLFVRSGTLHLFSVSGLHIAAVAVALHFLLGLLRLPRWPQFALNAITLWLYVDITGGSPSAVRAFWMVALVEAAAALRRPVNPVAALAVSALVCLLANPLQLFGASFQMSYGIVAGLLLLGLPLGELWQEKTALFAQVPRITWTWWQRGLSALQRAGASALGIGVATSLVSNVAGLLYFQLVTPGALVANLALIPISSFALWAGFLSLLCGLAGLDGASSIFNHAAAVILWAIEAAIRVFVRVPGAFVSGEFRSPAWGYAALGGLLVCLLHGYSTRWDWRRGGYALPFLWTAFALAVAVRYRPA